MVAPCKYCDRKGCGEYHSQCKEYMDYRKLIEKDYKRRKINALNYHTLKREG